MIQRYFDPKTGMEKVKTPSYDGPPPPDKKAPPKEAAKTAPAKPAQPKAPPKPAPAKPDAAPGMIDQIVKPIIAAITQLLTAPDASSPDQVKQDSMDRAGIRRGNQQIADPNRPSAEAVADSYDGAKKPSRSKPRQASPAPAPPAPVAAPPAAPPPVAPPPAPMPEPPQISPPMPVPAMPPAPMPPVAPAPPVVSNPMPPVPGFNGAGYDGQPSFGRRATDRFSYDGLVKALSVRRAKRQ